MGRRQFSREFKLEAVRLVRERGVSVAQAGRSLDIGENILRPIQDRPFPVRARSSRSNWRSNGSDARS